MLYHIQSGSNPTITASVFIAGPQSEDQIVPEVVSLLKRPGIQRVAILYNYGVGDRLDLIQKMADVPLPVVPYEPLEGWHPILSMVGENGGYYLVRTADGRPWLVRLVVSEGGSLICLIEESGRQFVLPHSPYTHWKKV